MSTNPRLVLIDWWDAVGLASGWHDKTVVERGLNNYPTLCTTVGFVYYEDDFMIVLYASSTGEEEYSDVNYIPKDCISDIIELKY